MENRGRRLQGAGAPTLGARPLSLRIPFPGSQGSRTAGQGLPRSHLMNQIGDLVFPPLLACWLLTFLLQGKETQS